MNALSLIGILLALAVIVLIFVQVRAMQSAKQISHSSAKVIRFASSAAIDVLSSNWENGEYYTRLYKYASPELASHMYENKQLLNRVLQERAELLGDFIEIQMLEQRKSGRFSLIPTNIIEVTGMLKCKKGSVPLIILVNGAKEDLSLDGIKVDKKAVIQH